MSKINSIIKYLKCVDCGNEELIKDAKGLKCPKCERRYLVNNSIFSMLPNEINKIKKNEIIARDKSSSKYDSKISKDYTSLLDTHCLYNKIDVKDIALDLGCGTGRTTIKIANISKYVFAVDYSIESLEMLRKKSINTKINNIFYFQADINRLPFNSQASFNFINVCDCIQHIPSFTLRENLINQIYSLLNKKGKLSITAYHYSKDKHINGVISKVEKPGEFGKQGLHIGGIYYYNFTKDEFYTLISNGGFRIIECKIFYFNFPFLIRVINKFLKIKRDLLEKITYKYLNKYGQRMYIYAIKD